MTFARAKKLYYGFTTLLVVNFVIAFCMAALGYVHSSYLGLFFSPVAVTILFSLLATCNIIALIAIVPIVRFIGIRTTVVLLIPLTQLAVLFYGIGNSIEIIIPFFIIQGVGLMLLVYLTDLYVESITEDETRTGNIRGIFLTSGNLAVFSAPIAIGFLVVNEYYPPLFAFVAISLVIAFALALTTLNKIKPEKPDRNSFLEAIRSLFSCRVSVAYAIVGQLILRMFFAWASIYAPLFLIASGYSWQVISVIFAIALIPYIIFEIPLGWLADKYFGEKEIMAIGFLVLGASVALLSFVPVALITLWGAVFFLTRIGAAMVEITTEGYFFRNVDETDSALVSLFRILNPLGLLGGSLIALAFLPVTGLQYIFGIFGAIILIGVVFAVRIADSR